MRKLLKPTRRLLLFLGLTAALIAPIARADGISGSITPQTGGGISAGFDGGIGGGGGVLWTPLNLGSALVAWWDAGNTANIVFSPNIQTWTDRQSGIVATASGAQPGWSATARNGKPGLTFDGATQRMTFTPAFPVGAQDRNISIAGFYNGAGGNYVFSYGGNAAHQMFDLNGSNTGGLGLYDGFAGYTAAESWSGVDRFVNLGFSAGAANWNVDGNAAEPFTLAGLNTTNAAGVIGAFTTQIARWQGVIQQICVMNRTLTTSELNKMARWESWYDGKAGSNLPDGHPYKSRPPLVSDP